MGWLRTLFGVFLPAEVQFWSYVAAAAAAAHQSAELFIELTEAPGREARIALVERIREAEHAGDHAMKQMSDALDATFVTPIDREDLYHLTSALENVSDFVSATANHLTVHQMDTLPLGSGELAQILVKATGQFAEAIEALRVGGAGDRVKAVCRSIQFLEHEADVVFRLRLGDLFAREKDAITLIKHKEFLEGLEDAVDRCSMVAKVMETIVIKNA
jgi:uncharacterized protein Yka (UPF0111/DUF47 family)